MMRIPIANFLLVCLSIKAVIAGAKVVVLMSAPFVSDVRAYASVARALAGYGHTVHVCIPHFLLDGDRVNTTGLNLIPYGEYLNDVDNALFQGVLERYWRGESVWLREYVGLIRSMQFFIRQILSDQTLINNLRTVHPDLFVLSNGHIFRNMVVLPYMLGASFVYMGTYNDLPGQRVPFSPSSTPCLGYPEFNDKGMGFFGRVGTSVCNILLILTDHYFMNDKLVEDFAPHRPRVSISDISKKAELFIIESDHILDYAKPETPSMKLIGSATLTPPSELNEPFRSFVERSERGFALVATADLPAEVAMKMAHAFQLLNLDVIWKINQFSVDASQVLTASWVPQNDLLASNKAKLFVTHCGTRSQYEALYHGVPMLCLPLYGDQFYNSERSRMKGFGLTASLAAVSYKQLAKLMLRVANTEKYRATIKRASFLFRMLYKSPSEAAAFWIDHVLEFGGSYMRSVAQEMPVYQFLMLDSLGFVCLAIFVLIAAVVYACKLCFKVTRACLRYVRREKFKKKVA